VVADEILEAMVHELAHQEVQEEGGPLLEAISRIYQRLGREKEKEYQDGIQRLITGSDGKLTAGYLAARRGYYARARADRRAPPTLELEDALRGGRALGQIISSGGLPEPPPPGGHGGPPARRSGAGHRTEPAKLPDPGLEAQIEGAVPPSPHPLAWLIDAGRTIPGYFVRDWPFLPQKDPALAELRYRFTHLDKAWGMANMNAVLNLARVYEGLNKNDQSDLELRRD